MDDLEVHTGANQQLFELIGLVLHCCLVVAHEVEQMAHLLRGLVRPPACLKRAGALKECRRFHSDQVKPLTDAIGLGGMQEQSSPPAIRSELYLAIRPFSGLVLLAAISIVRASKKM